MTATVPNHRSAVVRAASVTHHRAATIDGVNIFYREAGPAAAPVVLLLHGFPTSSHMFRNLIPALADRYHAIAPDYPGYGQSDMPDRTKFAYTFDRPEAPAADADRLGQERQDLPRRRGTSVQARPARRGVSSPRHRPLRVGGQGR